jgi:hypothetical protein
MAAAVPFCLPKKTRKEGDGSVVVVAFYDVVAFCDVVAFFFFLL